MSKVTELRCGCRYNFEESRRELCPAHWAEHLENEQWREQCRRSPEATAEAKLDEHHEPGDKR